MVVISNKEDLQVYLNDCEETKDIREAEKGDDTTGGEGEWPEFRREIVKLCFDKAYLRDALGMDPPPDLGKDWDRWLEDHLDEIIEEAISIVM